MPVASLYEALQRKGHRASGTDRTRQALDEPGVLVRGPDADPNVLGQPGRIELFNQNATLFQILVDPCSIADPDQQEVRLGRKKEQAERRQPPGQPVAATFVQSDGAGQMV